MHLLLTDRLTCPRCGPEFGLILLAERIENRRVELGVLGCPNCRDSFPIENGFGDVRAPPRRDAPAGLAGEPEPRPGDAAEAERLIALLGVAQGPGTLALVGGPARHGEALAAAVDGIHVVAVDPDLRLWPDTADVSRLMAAPRIPIFDRALRGAAVDGRLGPAWLVEAARVVARSGRVVVVDAEDDASASTADVLRAAGLDVLAAEGGTVVAARR